MSIICKIKSNDLLDNQKTKKEQFFGHSQAIKVAEVSAKH